jgi:hypothetical protein
VVSIPVQIDLASAGRAAAELAGGGKVEVGLSGAAEVAGIHLPLDLGARLGAH